MNPDIKVDCSSVWAQYKSEYPNANAGFTMSTINGLIEKLRSFPNSQRVKNPYLTDTVAENLRVYLEEMCSISSRRVLLVGEAPGYKGCGITGIPFTSGAVIQQLDHPLFASIRGRLTLDKTESENTASIVWNYLLSRKNVPLFWNSFPFHPHPINNPQKNRAPTRAEILFGVEILRIMNTIFSPDLVAGIGRSGVSCANSAFPGRSIFYIRHPSYGGKADFIVGMDNVLE